MKRGQTDKSGKYYQFYQHVKKRNADAAKDLLESLNSAAKAENCQVCMFILDRCFSAEFGRRIYRNTNVVSENLNQNIEIIVDDADAIRK